MKSSKSHDSGRGTINHNALAALVTSKSFTAKTERPKKGKGSYTRKGSKFSSLSFSNQRKVLTPF